MEKYFIQCVMSMESATSTVIQYNTLVKRVVKCNVDIGFACKFKNKNKKKLKIKKIQTHAAVRAN